MWRPETTCKNGANSKTPNNLEKTKKTKCHEKKQFYSLGINRNKLCDFL